MEIAEQQRYAELLGKRKQALSNLIGNGPHPHGLELHNGAPRRSEATDADSTADSMRDAYVAALARAARQLALIDAACERLAKGNYGVCVDCRDPIMADRLLVYPEAARCASCQGLFEHAHQDTARQAPT